jgi:hypothetical protein
MNERQSIVFREKLARLGEKDFKVKLGSIPESPVREYYVKHRFGYLEEQLAATSGTGNNRSSRSDNQWN